MSRRVIILGASNVRLGLRTILRTASELLPSPLDVYVACGFGRSYGIPTWIPFRSLPGIASSGLWEAIDARTPLTTAPSQLDPPPVGLITDVGNDLLYGVPVHQVLKWVDDAADRLVRQDARVVVTLPPVERVRRLSRTQFIAMRSVMFPESRLELGEMWEQVDQLTAGLTEIARTRSAHLIAPPMEWYGVDPIHIRASKSKTAWKLILTPWTMCDDALPHIESPSANARSGQPGFLWTPRSERRRVFGRNRVTPQPCFESDRLRISLY